MDGSYHRPRSSKLAETTTVADSEAGDHGCGRRRGRGGGGGRLGPIRGRGATPAADAPPPPAAATPPTTTADARTADVASLQCAFAPPVLLLLRRFRTGRPTPRTRRRRRRRTGTRTRPRSRALLPPSARSISPSPPRRRRTTWYPSRRWWTALRRLQGLCIRCGGSAARSGGGLVG